MGHRTQPGHAAAAFTLHFRYSRKSTKQGSKRNYKSKVTHMKSPYHLCLCGLVAKDAMTLFLLCMFSLSNYTGDCDLEAPFWLACTHTIRTISCAVLLKCYLIRTDPYHACNQYALCFIDIMQCGDVMSDAWCLLCDGGRRSGRQGLCTRLPAVWRDHETCSWQWAGVQTRVTFRQARGVLLQCYKAATVRSRIETWWRH